MTHEEFLAYLETHPEKRERWELLKKCMMQSRAEGMLYPEYQRMTDEEYLIHLEESYRETIGMFSRRKRNGQISHPSS